MQQETVIVLDFGGQYNQLIARRVRECNVYCEIYSYRTDLAKIKAKNPKGIIFTIVCSTCAHIRVCACTHIRTCTCCLCTFIHLLEHILCTLHQFLICSLELCNVSLRNILCICLLNQCFQSINVSLNLCFLVSTDLIAYFIQCFLRLEHKTIRLISCINSFFTSLILSLKLSCFLNSFLNLIIRHVRSSCDRNVLLFAGTKILSGYIYNTVGIDIECNFNLRNTSSCWRYTIKSELSK